MPVDLTTFFVIALLLTITPGVDTVLVLCNGVARGPLDGLATAAGICSGLLGRGACRLRYPGGDERLMAAPRSRPRRAGVDGLTQGCVGIVEYSWSRARRT